MSKEAKAIERIWNTRNPQHDINTDTGDDMFWGTVLMVFKDFANEQTQPLKDEIKELNKVILNHLEIESSNGRTFKSMSSKLTEANKQLKDSNFAIKTFVDNIDEWLDTGKAAGTKESKRIYDLCKAVLNKSKLNKD